MYPSKPLLISSGVASVRWLEAKFGRSERMRATLTCPPGSYMMRPRAFGPRGESVRSPLALRNGWIGGGGNIRQTLHRQRTGQDGNRLVGPRLRQGRGRGVQEHGGGL